MSRKEKASPTFGAPPVVETVLGVQFAPLATFTNAHFGWFWKSYLSDEWLHVNEVPALPDQFERFDASRWTSHGTRVSLRQAPEPERVQFIHRDDDRVIQVQGTRLLYNWRKRTGTYPRYPQRRAEFEDVFRRFNQFVVDAGLGEVALNQWEVTYINHVPQGELWNSPADWHKVIPSLVTGWQGFESVRFESLGGEWHYRIEPRRGRLHVAVKHGWKEQPPAKLLVLQLTSRGPFTGEAGSDLAAGLDCGHDAIVHGFVALTSTDAHQLWRLET